jgi:hypothetical protein
MKTTVAFTLTRLRIEAVTVLGLVRPSTVGTVQSKTAVTTVTGHMACRDKQQQQISQCDPMEHGSDGDSTSLTIRNRNRTPHKSSMVLPFFCCLSNDNVRDVLSNSARSESNILLHTVNGSFTVIISDI